MRILGLLITILIIGLLVWGTFYITAGDKKQNQIQQGQSDIDAAKNAAQQEENYNQSIQNDVQSIDNGGVNYRSVQQRLQK